MDNLKIADIPTKQKHDYLRAHHWVGEETPLMKSGWAWEKTINGVRYTTSTNFAVQLEENTGTALCKHHGIE